MRIRIKAAACGALGAASVVAGAVSALQAVSRLPEPEPGMILVALVRYYGLRGEILLIGAGLALLLAAGALLLSPRLRWVPGSAEQPMDQPEDTLAPAQEADRTPSVPAAEETSPRPEPPPVCRLRTALMGSTFQNPDGSSRQGGLEKVAAGDVLLCRASKGKDHTEIVGVFTVNGAQLGFLDAGFLRALRDRYPSCRMGIEVERIEGGNGLPYTCHLLVAVYPAQGQA